MNSSYVYFSGRSHDQIISVFLIDSETSATFSLLGAKVPWHFRSRIRKFHI